MILELVGHSNPIFSSTNVQGSLSVANNATFSENLYLSEDKIIRWENNNTSISGNDTSITIDGDANLNLSAGTEIKLDSDKLLLQHNINGILDFEIKNTFSSGTGGSSALTMVSDGGSAAGDTWQIKCSKSQMFFYSDVTTKGTVTTNIMTLTNHTNQSSRRMNIYGYLDIEEKIDMASGKPIYWGGSSQYITGDTNNFTIECHETLAVHADDSITFNCDTSSFTGNLDVGQGLDVTGAITCSTNFDIEGEIIMATNKKIKWVENTGPSIKADSTILTVDGKTKINSSATTSMTFTTPTATFSGNLNASSGMDVTGDLTCSGYLDIGGAIKMTNNDKIQWVDPNTFINGTTSLITIDGDTQVSIIGRTKVLMTTPLIEHTNSDNGGPELNR